MDQARHQIEDHSKPPPSRDPDDWCGHRFNPFVQTESPELCSASTVVRAKFQSLPPFRSLASELGEKVHHHLRNNEEWKLQRWALLDWLDRCLDCNAVKRATRFAFTAWEDVCCRTRMNKTQAHQVVERQLLFFIDKDSASGAITSKQRKTSLSPGLISIEEETTALQGDLERGEHRIRELEALVGKLQQLEQAHSMKQEEHIEEMSALEKEVGEQRMINEALAERMAELMQDSSSEHPTESGVQVFRIQDRTPNDSESAPPACSINVLTADSLKADQPEPEYGARAPGSAEIKPSEAAQRASVGERERVRQPEPSRGRDSDTDSVTHHELEAKYLAMWVCRAQGRQFLRLDRSA
eukprot:3169278-Rhodomonas_salina.3